MHTTLHQKALWTLVAVLAIAIALFLLAQISGVGQREILASGPLHFEKLGSQPANEAPQIIKYFADKGQPVPDSYKKFWVHHGVYKDANNKIIKAIVIISTNPFLTAVEMEKIADPTCEPVPGTETKPSEEPGSCPAESPKIPPLNSKVLNKKDIPSSFPSWNVFNDLNSHEASHGINSAIRYVNPGRKGTGIHIGFRGGDKNQIVYYWMDEPKGNIPGLKNFVPDFMKSSATKYQTYIGASPGSGWTELSYIFDEWGAYNMGGRTRILLKKAGQNIEPSSPPDPPTQLISANIVRGPVDFIVFGGAIVSYLKQADPSYHNSGQFKAVMKYQIETSMKVIKDAEGIWGQDSYVQSVLAALRNSKDSKTIAIRSALQEMFGCDWTKRVLGF